MSSSILDSIKKLLGIEAEDTSFDQDITIHINSAFSVLRQVGAAPEEGFVIQDKNTTWESYFQDRTQIEMVKSHVYLYVRLLFDPPATSYATEALRKQVNEIEWRLTTEEVLFNNDI